MKVTISQIESNTTDGVVITAHWNAILTDGDFSASSYGSAGFTRDADSPSLIPFASVTEADVVGWLDLDEGLEANLQAQIDEQKNPTTTTDKPWTPVTEEVEVA
jgi:hypothetical protein